MFINVGQSRADDGGGVQLVMTPATLPLPVSPPNEEVWGAIFYGCRASL